ncbi:GNAT family N-acetyltransferase [Paraburkholderia fungorum]|uniref:GNAT family N-acetyltransferase n=1 Tax=Paraburkholderia fungorum TaxID=134537 RepID=UPI0038B76A5D
MGQTKHAKQATRSYDIIRSEAEFRALQYEWEALWLKAHGFYYQSFSYCWLAWQQVAKPHGRHLRCIVCRENGRVVMIWPLVMSRRALWTYLVPLSPEGGDYSSVLVAEGDAAPALIEGAWQAARRGCGADFIHLPYLRERLHLYALVAREPHVLRAEAHESYVAKLRDETDWDQYCSTLGKLSGKRPGAFAHRLAREGKVATRIVDPADKAKTAAIIDWMLTCKREWGDRVGKHGEWLNSVEFRNFLVHLICPDDVPSMARLIVVTLDEAPVAAMVAGIGNPCASAVIAGFDAHYGKCRPGLIAVEACVKWAFENRFDIDFGVGSERFKSYWGRDNVSTAWTMQIVSSPWGLCAVRARSLALKLVTYARQWRRFSSAPKLPSGATASQSGAHGNQAPQHLSV